MLVYRIAKEQYISDLNGEGARLWGGRWNKPGVPVLYTSENRSLALLELLVHFNAKSAFSQHYAFAIIELPERHIPRISLGDLPMNFQEINNSALWKITEEYFYKANQLCIWVPSVLVNGEYNLLINPLHTDFQSVKSINIESAFLDKRFEKLI